MLNQDWTPDSFSNKTISEIKEKVGNEKVILGLIWWCGFDCSSYSSPQSYR